ncbi:MAG: tetratricopeptide repeat protein [Muribaculaceae bacterium]|nr:tetratricopeptide repeat protein [Muribaculaceae bacterium]
MTRILTLMTLAIVAVASIAAAPTAMDKAAQDYNQELYNKALAAYLAQAKTGEVSAGVYYNIGNTYYRLKDNAHAILYYERALLLEPGNSDARYNLDFVRTRAGIDQEQGSNILVVWIESAVGRLSSNAWAYIALAAFLLMLAAIAAYIWLDTVAWRKVGFFGAIVALLVTMVSMVCAWNMRARAQGHNQAIVITGPTALSTSPRTPKDKTEVAFELTPGFKVTIIDRVTTAGAVWCHVETANRRQAWINARDIEVI